MPTVNERLSCLPCCVDFPSHALYCDFGRPAAPPCDSSSLTLPQIQACIQVFYLQTLANTLSNKCLFRPMIPADTFLDAELQGPRVRASLCTQDAAQGSTPSCRPRLRAPGLTSSWLRDPMKKFPNLSVHCVLTCRQDSTRQGETHLAKTATSFLPITASPGPSLPSRGISQRRQSHPPPGSGTTGPTPAQSNYMIPLT